MPTPRLEPSNTLFFLCDVQTKFRPFIHGFDQVVATANRMLRLAKILHIEVVTTTQKAKGAPHAVPTTGAHGPRNRPRIPGAAHLGVYDKTLFSMVTPDVQYILSSRPHITSIVIFGIESHICVLQTVLALLALPAHITPHVLADGVSSVNNFEIPIALNRMRAEGAVIGTSESVAFQLIGDAGIEEFRTFSALVKNEKDATRMAGQVLIQNQNQAAGEVEAPPVKSVM
ncbi:Isochorismatase-like protein [Infundibulicybe gibba]|nr:Isochorismatase-like protein [Infundibulicybe gibba]